MGKITKQQLSDGLLEYIASNKGSNITFKKNSVVIPNDTNIVPIGIQGYNKNTDLLMVYKNTVYLEETIMYTISSDSNYINNPNGNWDTGTLFNFIVIKNNGSGNNLPDSGNSNFEIADGSITEAKLHQNVKDKLNDISTLKETVRYKNVSILESDLDQDLKEKLNIGGAKTWGSLKNELAKTWANLMGQ